MTSPFPGCDGIGLQVFNILYAMARLVLAASHGQERDDPSAGISVHETG